MTPRRPAPGFAYIAAVVLLVVVAGLAVAMVRLTASQQNTAQSAALTARASQAARAGVEWMFYRVKTPSTAPCTLAGTATTLSDFKTDTGFLVTVTCSFYTYNEGQDPASGATIAKNIYKVVAVACNGTAASCPDNASAVSPDYIERRRVATACVPVDTSVTPDCY